MSKPVTQDEVEDVLSSIRRLVSEDKRPLAGLRNSAAPEGADDADRPKARTAEKLVLTPALRVTQPPKEPDTKAEGPLVLEDAIERDSADWDNGSADAAAPTKSDAFEEGEDTTDTEARVLEALLQETAEEGEDLGDRDSDGDLREEPANDLYQPPEEETFDDEDAQWDDSPHWDDTPVEDAAAQTSYFPDVEEDDAPDADEEDAPRALNRDWARGFVEEDDTAAPYVPEDMPEDEAEVRDADEENDLRSEREDESDTPEADPFERSLTSKIAALETAIGSIRQDFEPEGREAEDIAPAEIPPMAWEDDVELDAKGTPLRIERPSEPSPAEPAPEATSDVETQTEAAPTSAPDALGLDDQLMDEEALRDLVSEIVRAELQGALGERITRNVRKLVRREIHRALTAQELE